MKEIKTDVCQVQCIHPEAINRVKEQMPSQDILLDLADFFMVFGDHTRIRILTALYQEELCVCVIWWKCWA